MQLENIFDVMDIYLWLSYRFPDMFPDAESVRKAQSELDKLIQQGVEQLTRLVNESTKITTIVNVNDTRPTKSNYYDAQACL